MNYLIIRAFSRKTRLAGWVKEHKTILLTSSILLILQFILFKIIYPFPNFLPESTSYIEAAKNHQPLNSWPIAYSKFLFIFHFLSHFHLLLVLFQYFFLELNILFFLFTISEAFDLNKKATSILFILNVCNPVILHISNFISSDSLFVGLSLCWFSLLMQLINKPRKTTFFLHVLVLILAFSLRYFALYYPLISIATILFLKMKASVKVSGISLIVFCISGYFFITVKKYQKYTNTTQFSSFGGWQLAANALYGYAHSPLDSLDQVPPEFRPLHKVVNEHMMWLNTFRERPDAYISIYYQWNDHAPLKYYMSINYSGDSTTGDFQRYAVMGKLYGSYGYWLIRRHPINYLRYFAIPNFIDYYAPDTEFMGSYNMGFDSVSNITMKWFDLKTARVYNRLHSKTILEIHPYTIFFPIVNVIFIVSLLFTLSAKLIRQNLYARQIVRLTVAVWSSTILFGSLSAYVILRYEIFPFIITLTFSIVMLALLLRELKSDQVVSHQT